MWKRYTFIAILNLILYLMMRIWVIPYLIWGLPYVFTLHLLSFAFQYNWVIMMMVALYTRNPERYQDKNSNT